ncbi:MAG: RecQ family ATP-dependent DNA helicase [Bacillota bacterium]|uniref:ATP-dependent DNA helicase RecQ n=1 Tax=Virgibacillus salarius TaxID=447199 RepID=A0A941IAN3_9BACI|nr:MULTISPECIES: ATP-dependent DNA helicase RecQ [Bacillaceae]MBR7795526.1 ATP-dependent DNA helicase RecQ [Virgibacillus salarius]NAZ08239.1 RecQ family ATP-dependent DNA helicase [Agaribacter marinus]MCC2249048.1 ATP-dependent DNA helicase [Virgibacillus sp. AGTR]MDY7043408.1 ATP-dependent DNA helicase RecQ [Virgibacillus sp. M23]QRZ16988.1 ATP-dependent DNA helicase RecQ [Virgibacillus sp. AGTR]
MNNVENQLNLRHELKKHFGYDAFRKGQREIIEDVMRGENVLGILPTGSGKSICYQLPAKLLDGVTIVVSPLISLMIDQVKHLKAMNFKQVVAINSFMNRSERYTVWNQLHTYKLIYLSPELLQQDKLQRKLRQLQISLFVIDEAHCISQWGHEFRPDYLKLSQSIESYGNPPVLALSATATPKVQEDIIEALGRKGTIKHVHDMDRDNIAFYIQHVNDDSEKLDTMARLFKRYRVPTLIYFSSRRVAEDVAHELSNKLSYQIAVYHGGMEQHDRVTIQQQFMNNQLDIVCCTSAFGMGINKSNIRLVIHYHMPPQMEAFIQEVGRAGRDGEQSISLLLFSIKDIHLPKNIIKKELPLESDITSVFKRLFTLFSSNQSLPEQMDERAGIFQMNEVQWRFMQYQLEKHGIIKKNRIFYDQRNWQRALHKIIEHRNSRTHLKEQKLTKMIHWIQQKACFRKHLYQEFQTSYATPTSLCCSNCGFSWDEWNPVQTTIKRTEPKTWREKLQEKLLHGDIHETT